MPKIFIPALGISLLLLLLSACESPHPSAIPPAKTETLIPTATAILTVQFRWVVSEQLPGSDSFTTRLINSESISSPIELGKPLTLPVNFKDANAQIYSAKLNHDPQGQLCLEDVKCSGEIDPARLLPHSGKYFGPINPFPETHGSLGLSTTANPKSADDLPGWKPIFGTSYSNPDYKGAVTLWLSERLTTTTP